jgi:MinD-like ATPase involved in chromosome partitioning or flagellar assembly
MRVLVVTGAPRAAGLAEGLRDEGLDADAVVPAALSDGAVLAEDIDVLLLDADPAVLTARLVSECDQRGIRIAPLGDDATSRRLAERFGLASPLAPETDAWVIAEALRSPSARRSREIPPPSAGRVIVVWGSHGAPGRTTLAVELAAELCRGGQRVALADADTHAPSVALALGLADEGPGFAAACRQAGLGGLDAAELERISVPLRVAGGTMDVLAGINRPSRWPELSAERVGAVLDVCRMWTPTTVVDVAAPLERDEEIVSDLDGPRRNAATLAALEHANLVVAVCAGDPIGVSRFVRAYGELRAAIGATPVAVVVNRMRPGTLGVDARGQIRRTLERFADIGDVSFVPLDPRPADAALLTARPVADASPRSPMAAAVRRLVGELIAPPAPPVTRERVRGRRPGAARQAQRSL